MKNFFKKINVIARSVATQQSLLVSLIFIIALSLRLYGLNWDQGTHLHPDERFLTMVVNDIKVPSSINEYFNNSQSPLNPYNYPNYQFFVYGTFPIFITKFIAVGLRRDNYDDIVLVGRVISAIFDASNIFLLYFLAKKIINRSTRYLFLPSILYAFCVLPLQLSHFFTVDTFLCTFILATFVLAIYGQLLPAAIMFGLALSSKISAIYFTPIVLLILFQRFIKTKKVMPMLFLSVGCLVITLSTFRVFQPYIFDGLLRINSHFIENINTLKTFSSRDTTFPPSIQWLSKTPLLFPLQNIIFWGLGLPLSIGLFVLVIKQFHYLYKNWIVIDVILWILLLFVYQGSQFTPTMRYFLPLYPYFIVLFVYLLSTSTTSRFMKSLIILHFIYAFSFLSIYSHPHTRVSSSLWIYQKITPGATITNEYWDDPLPLNVNPYNASIYKGTMISPYDPDSVEKIQKLHGQVGGADYIIMSSNRLWGSIPLVPKLYPLTSRFYMDIFSEKTNFKKILEVNSYPGFSLPFLQNCYYFGYTNYPGVINRWYGKDSACLYPGVYLRDDTAEEAFTVYDHPKVLIYQGQK